MTQEMSRRNSQQFQWEDMGKIFLFLEKIHIKNRSLKKSKLFLIRIALYGCGFFVRDNMPGHFQFVCSWFNVPVNNTTVTSRCCFSICRTSDRLETNDNLKPFSKQLCRTGTRQATPFSKPHFQLHVIYTVKILKVRTLKKLL